MAQRIAIIGDVAGLVSQLRSCLSRLGVTDGVWPDGLHVIQIGDLFGGNDDLAVAQLVEPHLAAGRWTQLIGNWELAAVGGPRVSRNGVRANPDAMRVFSRWFGDGLVHYAAAVRPDKGPDALVTHAGLTSGWWTAHLDRDADVESVARQIDAAHPAHLHFAGEMAGFADEAPSPVWASTRELWTSWSDTPLPWPQIHGHTTAFDAGCGWMPWVPADLIEHCSFDAELHHTVYTPVRGHDGAVIRGIDPGLWSGSPPDGLRALSLLGSARPLTSVSR